ncbi:MAG: hypothetical protein ACP5RS_04945 [Thermoplasmata archaeon]
MYVIFSVTKDKLEKAKKILTDDLVSRQSITIRDGTTLKNKKDNYIILIEGTEEGIKKAESMLSTDAIRMDAKESEPIYNELKEESQNIADGLGAIFSE